MTNEQTNLKMFFESLAERMHNENDLSDMTYALCNANDEFRKFFLSYCFEEDIDTRDLSREYTFENSRPDFFFHDMNNCERIIEVKIYDQNQHFMQYQRKYPKAKFSFIANYRHEAVDNWHIKTWKEFLSEINNSDLVKDDIVKHYIIYVQFLIDIQEFKKMNLKNMKDLPTLLDDIGNVATQDFGFGYYNNSKSCNQYYYGQFFNKKDLYFWMGLVLNENKIYIGFKNCQGWAKQLTSGINKVIDTYSNAEYFDEPYENPDWNYGDYWFALKQDKFDILCDNTKSEKEQKEVLSNFIKEVFTLIGAEKYLK